MMSALSVNGARPAVAFATVEPVMKQHDATLLRSVPAMVPEHMLTARPEAYRRVVVVWISSPAPGDLRVRDGVGVDDVEEPRRAVHTDVGTCLSEPRPPSSTVKTSLVTTPC